jgi:hypothetical protein
VQVPYFIHPHRNNLSWISASKQMASLDACSAAHDAAPVGRGYHGGLLLPRRQAFILQVVQKQPERQLYKQVFQYGKGRLLEREREEAAKRRLYSFLREAHR